MACGGCAQIGKVRTDDPEEETKQKAFKSHLNKLTPDNFDRLSAKILEVGIEQAKTLRSLIDQVSGLCLSHFCCNMLQGF